MSFQIRQKISFIACFFIYGTFIMNADVLREGRDAFMNYDFDLAREKYAKYAQILKKTPDAFEEELLENYNRQLEIAENSLDNVQKIEIIDRIDVPAADFFKYIKLPASGGKLVSPELSIIKNASNSSDFAFSTESGDLMMWSEMGEDNREHIIQSEKLLDGTWEPAVKIAEILNDGGNARNPFLLNDGVTLYYSGDGEGSMGGFDLFVATKDPATGEFRQPVGVGFPFNSPYNEYLMAIDDDNGIGWWVTDRNQLDGQVSVYVFKTNDIRKNYVLDEEDDIISLARVDDISITQDSSTDYARILKEIDNRSRQAKVSDTADFIFPLPEGKIARRLSDFSSPSARRNMQQYLQAQSDYNASLNKLSGLRKKYHNTEKKKGSSTALRNQILDLEVKVENQADMLKKMRNAIISAELKH